MSFLFTETYSQASFGAVAVTSRLLCPVRAAAALADDDGER